jgi:hypothetical protein
MFRKLSAGKVNGSDCGGRNQWKYFFLRHITLPVSFMQENQYEIFIKVFCGIICGKFQTVLIKNFLTGDFINGC